MLRATQGPAGVLLFGLMLLLDMGPGWFSIGFFRANAALMRDDLDAVTIAS